jgi:hypothetical protein
MFRLVKTLVAPWPVTVRVVTEAGAVEEQTLTLLFERIGVAEFNALFSSLPAEDIAAHNRRIFDRVVRGWRDLVDEEGRPIAWPQGIDALLDFPGFPEALGRAYVAFHLAQREAREGNSRPSPAGSPAAGGATGGTPASGRA